VSSLRVAARRAPITIRNLVRDLRFGAPLAGTVKTRFGDLGAYDTSNAIYEDLEPLFAAAEVRPEDVIVDVGCGKGRAINWLLAHYPANAIYGIELDPEICAKTARRLRRRPQVTILCGDATALLPAEATLFYLFSPFDETVMRRFATALLELGKDRVRRVVYYRCVHVDVFLQDDRFEVTPITGATYSSALIQAK
jgi:SAM-dependent methyltransferase